MSTRYLIHVNWAWDHSHHEVATLTLEEHEGKLEEILFAPDLHRDMFLRHIRDIANIQGMGSPSHQVTLYRIEEGLRYDRETQPFEDQTALSAARLTKICTFDADGNPVMVPLPTPTT